MICTNLPQLACIEQPFGCEAPKACCPICGQTTNNLDLGYINSCEHLAFVYLFSCSEFEYKSEEFLARTKAFELERIPLEDPVPYLQRAGYSNNLLALMITYGGMANGPTWSTDMYGFDFDSLNKANANNPP